MFKGMLIILISKNFNTLIKFKLRFNVLENTFTKSTKMSCKMSFYDKVFKWNFQYNCTINLKQNKNKSQLDLTEMYYFFKSKLVFSIRLNLIKKSVPSFSFFSLVIFSLTTSCNTTYSIYHFKIFCFLFFCSNSY